MRAGFQIDLRNFKRVFLKIIFKFEVTDILKTNESNNFNFFK